MILKITDNRITQWGFNEYFWELINILLTILSLRNDNITKFVILPLMHFFRVPTQELIFLPALFISSADKMASWSESLSTVCPWITVSLSTYQSMWYSSVSSAEGVKEHSRLMEGSCRISPGLLGCASLFHVMLWKETLTKLTVALMPTISR